jgi:hypothetical protein
MPRKEVEMLKNLSLSKIGLLALTLASGFMLGGCANPFADEPVIVSRTVPLVYRGPIYCYDSIGDPNCFAEPFPRPEERFIGAMVPPGSFPGASTDGSDGSNTVPSN